MAMKQKRLLRPGYISTVEVVFYLPLVILAFAAILQFSKVLSVEARLAGASREGVRVAASGGNSAQISDAVFAAMLPAEKNLVSIESNAVDSQGKPLSMVAGETVVVRVSMPTTNAVSSPLGFILDKNRVLIGQTVMRKE